MILTGAAEYKSGERNKATANTQAQQSVAAALPLKPTDGAGDTKAADPKCKDDSGAEANCTIVATDAARQQATDADWQAWAGLGGVAIGLLTLIAAGVAAWYARKAANETWRGANAAQYSADSFVKVEDASLILAFPSGHVVTGSVNYYSLHVNLSNVGRSTALIHSIKHGDDDPVIGDFVLPPDTTKKFQNMVHVEKIDGEISVLITVITYSTALRERDNLKIYASVLLDKTRQPSVPLAFVTRKEWIEKRQ